MLDIWRIIALLACVGFFGSGLAYMLWLIYRQQQPEPSDWLEATLARQQQQQAAPPITETEEELPELELEYSTAPAQLAPPPEPRIHAYLWDGTRRTTFDLPEPEYQSWLKRRQQRQAEQARQRAELEQARAAARLEAEAQQTAEARALAEFPTWLVAFGAEYKITRSDELELLQNWIALVLQYSLNRHAGNFPVKPVWRGVSQEHGQAAPDSRFTSYLFFLRLNDALIEQGLVSRGGRGVAARLKVDNLPQWAA